MEKEDQVQEYVRENGGNAAFHNYINDFSHIKDPLERRRLALEKIDNAGFSWRSIYLILVAGIGFLNDSYDIFTISIALTMMTPIYFSGSNALSYGIETWVKTATSVGAVLGQVGFGVMSDVLGRKKVYGLELDHHCHNHLPSLYRYCSWFELCLLIGLHQIIPRCWYWW